MQIIEVPFTITDWSQLPKVEYPGTTGHATWRTFEQGNIRVRMVEYSPGYMADHWCERGHVVLCLAGEFVSELSDGSTHTLRPGMSYQVADGLSSHRSQTATGATLFIVD